MKKASILISSVLMLLVLSSFGIAENNKYVRAKTHQIENNKSKVSDLLIVNDDVSKMQVGTFEEELTEKKKSIASSIGAFLLDSIKFLVKNVFTLLKN